MKYFEYQIARNMAWQVLIEQNILHFPVNVSALCISYNCILLSYDRAHDILVRYGLLDNCKNNDGFALRMRGRIFIFYNNKCSPGRIRFTVAHELGHVLLGHLNISRNSPTIRNREPSPYDNPFEQQANVFASRLLAPACIIDKLNMHRPEQLMTFFGISHQSAEYRLLRMEIVQNRKKFGVNFRTHFLEKQVVNQLRPFVKWAKKLEDHQSFAQFQIVRDGRVIGTTLGITSNKYPEIIGVPPDVDLLEGDTLKPTI